MLLAQDPAPDAVNAPPVVSAPGGDREEQVSLASVARAATRGVQVYPSVSSAEFAITGDPRAPHLTLTLAFTPSPENQRIKDEIRHELLPGLEAIIGAPFAQVTLDYTTAEQPAPQAPVVAA